MLFFPEGLVKEEGKRIQVSLFDHKEIITMVLLLLPGKQQNQGKLLEFQKVIRGTNENQFGLLTIR